MSAHDLDGKIKELRELRRMADELATEIEAITDSIKAEMTARSVDELDGTDWRATWKEVVTSRLDIKAIKKAVPDLVEKFTVTTSSKRFCLA